jgi:pimeloyl-ACP methyl ester carboxylesterase
MSSRSIFIATSALLSLACSQPRSYVLVHGAWMGAWAWTDVQAELEADGHDVRAVELPAHGSDAATFADVSLDSYVARVAEAVDASARPVVLVGHSMGGLVISQLAEERADDIEELIYVAAFLPRDGESLLALSSMDPDAEIGGALTDDGSDGTLDIRTDALVDIFCAECDEAAQARLLARYREEPSLPATQSVALGAAFASVPRSFVRTTNDRAISPAHQQRMIDQNGVDEQVDLASDHSPMLSHARELAEILESF